MLHFDNLRNCRFLLATFNLFAICCNNCLQHLIYLQFFLIAICKTKWNPSFVYNILNFYGILGKEQSSYNNCKENTQWRGS